jgi:hypothetical protein
MLSGQCSFSSVDGEIFVSIFGDDLVSIFGEVKQPSGGFLWKVSVVIMLSCL